MQITNKIIFLNWIETRGIFTEVDVLNFSGRENIKTDGLIRGFIKSGELFKLTENEIKTLSPKTTHKFFMCKRTYEKFFKRKDGNGNGQDRT